MKRIEKKSHETFNSRLEVMRVAAGREPSDLVIVGGLIVNVNVGTIEKGDIAIKGNRIAVVGDVDYTISDETTIIDVNKQYVCPGFIDAHIHIDDSLLTVTEFAKLAIPHGTLTVIEDPHEIGNVLGIEGVLLFREEANVVPMRIFFTAPSSVPSVPQFETAVDITTDDVHQLLRLSDTVGLAEVMDYLGIIDGDNIEARRKIELTIKSQKVVDGHFANLEDKDLQAYIAVGNQSDHEARTAQQVLDRLRLGLRVMINGGRVKQLLHRVIDVGIDTRHCLLDTDDRHAGDIATYGLMDYNIKETIEAEIDPVKAIQMGTLNVAEYFGLERDLGSIGPGKLADLVIIDDFERFNIKKVLYNGKLVAENNRLLVNISKFTYPNWAMNTVKIKQEFSPQDFVVQAPNLEKTQVRVISLSTPSFIEVLRVKNNSVQIDLSKDIVKMAILERYGINGNISVGFIHGTGLQKGALATTITHDSHNISVAGVNDDEMYHAVKRIKQMQGGYVVVANGEILEELALPIAGLMTQNLNEAIQKQNLLRKAAESIGLKPPLLRQIGTTFGLPGYPGRGNRGQTLWNLTDVGLVDYVNRRVLNVVV